MRGRPVPAGNGPRARPPSADREAGYEARASTSETPRSGAARCRRLSAIVPLGGSSAAPNARSGASRRPSAAQECRVPAQAADEDEAHAAGLRPRSDERERLVVRLQTAVRSPRVRRASNPRAPSDVLTFDHSSFAKTWPTGKGELSVAIVPEPRGRSNEAAPALAISTAPTGRGSGFVRRPRAHHRLKLTAGAITRSSQGRTIWRSGGVL